MYSLSWHILAWPRFEIEISVTRSNALHFESFSVVLSLFYIHISSLNWRTGADITVRGSPPLTHVGFGDDCLIVRNARAGITVFGRHIVPGVQEILPQKSFFPVQVRIIYTDEHASISLYNFQYIYPMVYPIHTRFT